MHCQYCQTRCTVMHCQYCQTRCTVMHCHALSCTVMHYHALSCTVNIVRHGVFSVKSFTNNESERYTVDFGDNETMPKCTCQDWALSYYPCKHFFAIFRKYIPWQWDALSPPYIKSPFLTLDNLDDTAENNNTVEKSNENKAEFNAGNSLQKPQMKTGLVNVSRNLYILMKKELFLKKYQAVKEPKQIFLQNVVNCCRD